MKESRESATTDEDLNDIDLGACRPEGGNSRKKGFDGERRLPINDIGKKNNGHGREGKPTQLSHWGRDERKGKNHR